MTKKFSFIFIAILISGSSFGQVIDRISINLGPTFSTQLWDSKSGIEDEDYNYKLGFMAFVAAEKNLNKTLGLRSEFGYIQKGFKSNFSTMVPNREEGIWNKNYVKLHNMSLDLGLKITPLSSDYSPYMLIGIRGDYMFSYRDAIIKDEQGKTYPVFEDLLDQYNKFNVGGLFALGIDLKDMFYLELEYNPGFTKNFEGEAFDVKDKCWGAKVGFYLNNILH